MKVERKYLFCYWEWVLAFFYIVGLYPYPHLVTLFISLIYTSITAIMFSNRTDVTIAIIVWECFVLYMVYMKWVTSGMTMGDYRLLPDVVLFGLYLGFLYVNGETFYSIYVEKVPSVHKKFSGGIWSYVTR